MSDYIPGGLCDFCSDPHPVVNEAAEDFVVQPGPAGKSIGAWGACRTCHGLIVREDWLALEDRAVEAMRRLYPHTPVCDVLHAVQAIQAQFRSHRRGTYRRA